MTPQEAYAKIVEENGGVAPEIGLFIWEPTHMFKDMTRTQLLRFIRENMIE